MQREYLVPLSVTFIVIGFLLIILDLYVSSKKGNRRLRPMKRRTLAVITDIHKHKIPKYEEKKYTVTYKCYIKNEEREFQMDTNRKYKVGQSVDLLYNPKNPEEQIIAVELTHPLRPLFFVLPVVCIIVGAVLVLVDCLWPIQML